MAGRYDFTIEQGATFERVLTWKDSAGVPVDLSGYTARLKAKAGSLEVLTLTDTDSLILGGTDGTIAITLNATETAALDFTSAGYDLELQSSAGKVTRLLRGTITLSTEYTA